MKLLKTLGAALVLCVAGNAFAVGDLADVTVYDRLEHRLLPVYYHEGKHYVVGRPGNEYQIVIRNRTGEDVLAVVSVDGVNAVTGETASTSQSGYILPPWQTIEIKGWRKSLKRTAAFFFTGQDNSYASRTGRPENVGVIGVALFKRKMTPPAPPAEISRERRSPATPGEGASADSAAKSAPSPRTEAQAEKSLGTGHGRSEHSPVRYAEFERASSTPEEEIAIYYDSYRNLVAKGVIIEPRAPQPFPARFVPDPPKY